MWSAARASAAAAPTLTPAELRVRLADLMDAPRSNLVLQVQLPKLLSPTLGRLCEAMAADDEGADETALDDALAEIDTPLERARLARAVLAARDAGRLDAQLAAVALLDLAGGSRGLLCASLLEAIAVRIGAARTPAGLLVAA
jgi:hypothetical protein